MTIDYLAALKTEHALVSVLPKLPKAPFDSKDSVPTSKNPQTGPRLISSDTVADWRPPDGRKVRTSPAETEAEIEGRHPGATPLPDSVTVTEPTSAKEAAAIAYAEKIRAIREQGRVPNSYTATTSCEQCGPVFIFEGAPPRVTACPWCHNRARNLPIPRPPVMCASCRHWRHDLAEPYAIVICEHTKARYPGERKPCTYFQSSEDKQ